MALEFEWTEISGGINSFTLIHFRDFIMSAWREAATVIILARHGRKRATEHRKKKFNYDILFQKRTQKVTFPDRIVFPGGKIEETDFSDAWLTHFQSCGIEQEKLHIFSNPSNLMPILQNNSFYRHMGLRIAAIRETFEEVGILICNEKSSPMSTWASAFTNLDVKEWQSKVHNNSSEFLNMCQHLNCYPNIWALQIRNNWLTPFHIKKRFDTIFFMATFNETPDVSSEQSEVAELKWATVDEVIEQNERKEINIMGPQKYELLRMSRYPDLDELMTHAAVDAASCSRPVYYPVIMDTQDGSTAILPGDDLYPKDIDFTVNYAEKLNVTKKELRSGCNTMHRMETSPGQIENWQLVTRNLQFSI